jgi:hypothetical protein
MTPQCCFRALLLATVALAACAPVHAYERGTLARDCMRPDARPEETRARTHMLGAREGSQGAGGDRGGGCGCGR